MNLFIKEGLLLSLSLDVRELQGLLEKRILFGYLKNNLVVPNCPKSNLIGSPSSLKMTRSSKRWLKFHDLHK